MDTVEFTPYRPTRRISTVIATAAGLLLGVCGTTLITTTAGGGSTKPPTSDSAAAPSVAAKAAATQRQLRAADCRYFADVRRVRHGMLPWSADAAAEWLSHTRRSAP